MLDGDVGRKPFPQYNAMTVDGMRLCKWFSYSVAKNLAQSNTFQFQ